MGKGLRGPSGQDNGEAAQLPPVRASSALSSREGEEGGRLARLTEEGRASRVPLSGDMKRLPLHDAWTRRKLQAEVGRSSLGSEDDGVSSSDWYLRLPFFLGTPR